MRANLVITVLLSSIVFQAFSQGQKPYGGFSNTATKKTEKKILRAARNEVDYGNYSGATEKYVELLKLDSTNPMYNFEQAQNLYNNFHQTQSIPYFETMLKYSKDSIGEAYYFLANAYHLDAKFDQAQKNYKIYLDMLNYHGTALSTDEEADLKNEVLHKIEMCDNGKLIYTTPPADKFTLNGKTRPFQILNVGKDVNSDYDDYDAVLSANDSVMYFTTRREGTTGGKIDWDDKFFEDIYISNLGKAGWEKSFPMGAPVNTKKHEAIINMAPDGKTIYFYRGVKQGTFYYSTQQGGNVWSEPKVLYEKSDMNTKAWETSFFGFTLTTNELYVVSDREGGTGGRDIYVSQKQSDGSWGALYDIGPPINTKYDEDAPFITPDGKTMYFSSTGHNSMGGFDIFKSEKEKGIWSEPVNIGRPFNTPGNDIYFVVANKSDRAYYSSSSLAPDGTKDMDIYLIDLCDDIPETMLSGITVGIPYANITVTEKTTGAKVADIKIENGRYAVRLKHGADYRFTLNYGSVVDPVPIDVSIPKLCKVYDMYQELTFTKPGQPLVVKNAFFDMKTAAGKGSYSDYLSKVDKNTALYSEMSVPTTFFVAKVDTTSPSTTTSATSTVTASTTTSTASTHTTIATTTTTTTTATTTTTTATSTAATVTTISVNNVLFDYDRSTLNPEFTAELDKAAEFLKKAKNAKIDISGYTDAKGSDAYNLALSKRRADAVAAYLASKGISRSRLKTTGYGESKPIAANENPDGSDNPEGRAKNRRTEITVIQ